MILALWLGLISGAVMIAWRVSVTFGIAGFAAVCVGLVALAVWSVKQWDRDVSGPFASVPVAGLLIVLLTAVSGGMGLAQRRRIRHSHSGTEPDKSGGTL